MIRNYFYLLRNIKELNSLVNGRKITGIYTQEKDVLFLDLENLPNRENEAILISTDFQFPYIRLKKGHRKAKKNIAEFCVDETHLQIEGLFIATKDRIIKFVCSNSDIYFVIRGPKTNILFAKENQLLRAFKKKNDYPEIKNLFAEISRLEYLRNEEDYYRQFLSEFSFVEITENSEREIRKSFPQINKEIFLQFRSTKYRISNELIFLLEEILKSEIKVILTTEHKTKLLPKNWNLETTIISEEFIFDNFQDALEKYIHLKYKYGAYSSIFSEIEKKINKELEYYSNKINSLRLRLEKGSREAEYRAKADLLIANLHLIKKGMEKIELKDFSTMEPIEIELNVKISPSANAKRYYEKAYDERINYEKSKLLLENAEEKYNELLEIKKKLVSIDDLKILNQLKKKLKLEDKTKRTDLNYKIKYRRFLIEGKYNLYVGKDSNSNDALTLKFAKQNDIWFHARGVSGSHTILRIENNKEPVPKSVLKKAASVAAFFSKAKTAKLVPVAYTFRKFVHKKKGMPPGQVTISRENVLIVPPEIPKNTEEIYE